MGPRDPMAEGRGEGLRFRKVLLDCLAHYMLLIMHMI